MQNNEATFASPALGLSNDLRSVSQYIESSWLKIFNINAHMK